MCAYLHYFNIHFLKNIFPLWINPGSAHARPSAHFLVHVSAESYNLWVREMFDFADGLSSVLVLLWNEVVSTIFVIIFLSFSTSFILNFAQSLSHK